MKILLHCKTCYIAPRRSTAKQQKGEGRMKTRILLKAVLRNRRSQWTLLPKAEADPDADAAAVQPAQPARDCAPVRPSPSVRAQ